MCDGQGRSPFIAHFLLKKSILHIDLVKLSCYTFFVAEGEHQS